MSNKYTLKQFMPDFIALWRTPESQITNHPEHVRGPLMRAFFQSNYGQDAEAFGALHMKAVAVLADYLGQRRPELAKAVERTPNSLLIAIFFLVSERGLDHPTVEQIEAAEATQSPQN